LPDDPVSVARVSRVRAIAVLVASVSILLGSIAAPVRAYAPAAPQDLCASFDGPLCSIALPTGVTMRYLDIGPHGGPVTVLLHGFGDSVQSWSLVVPQLRRMMPWERFLVPDLRGQGDTTQPPAARCADQPDSCFRPVDYANDVLALMDAEHVARATLVGHSVGTLVAQEIALDHPDRVNRLVLIATAADGQQPLVEAVQSEVVQGEWQSDFTAAGYAWPSGVYGLTPGVAVPDFDEFIDDEFEVSAVAPPSLLAQLQAGAKLVQVGTWIGTLDDLVLTDNTLRLQRLGVPTLVLWGIQDDIFSRDTEQSLIDVLEAAAHHGTPFWWKQYGLLPPPDSGDQTDLGHALPWEAPLGVATDTAAFLTLGAPTCTLYHTNYPQDIHRVLAVPGAATVIHAGAGPTCLP
jgi:pimeloyl-ACP methyl ester carboxylesterase